MITDQLKNWHLYSGIADLRAAFEFLQQAGDARSAAGRIDIDGDRLFALPQAYQPKQIEQGRFEAHRRYADIQYVVEGVEMMGYAALDGLQVEDAYDETKDIAFYSTPNGFSAIVVPAGSFAVFCPVDGHMPGIRTGNSTAGVRKLVVKVLLP
ncbi:MAG: YhcH/YjgK/YiaL family protein [Armatimonadota bacterium]|jgi:YhcH/YjgK/YiaL family protein